MKGKYSHLLALTGAFSLLPVLAMAEPDYTVWCGGQSWLGWSDYSECQSASCDDVGGMDGPVISSDPGAINRCYDAGSKLTVYYYNTNTVAMGPYKKGG